MNLYCIVSCCISFFNSDDKDSKQSNNDQAMPHLHQGMEHQTKSKVLAHWSWSNVRLKCSNILAKMILLEKIYNVMITFKEILGA